MEDTDHLRSTPEAIQILLDTLNWLNISIDEEPLYQSTRINDHLNVAEGLIQKGFAYRSKKRMRRMVNVYFFVCLIRQSLLLIQLREI